MKLAKFYAGYAIATAISCAAFAAVWLFTPIDDWTDDLYDPKP